MLHWRITLGAALVILLAGVGWADLRAARPGVYATVAALVVAGLGASEIVRMARALGAQPSLVASVVGAMLPVAGCGLAVIRGGRATGNDPLVGLVAGLMIGNFVAFAVEMRRVLGQGRSMANLGFSLLAVHYVGGLLAMLLALRSVASTDLLGRDHGMTPLLPLLSLVAIVKASDIGQYFGGRRWGRRKLAPRLSPGKTWEGAAAGAVVAAALGGLILPALGAWEGRIAGCLFGISLAIAGMFGDLAESLLKREAGVKDSSDWMPGFGGVLDLMDSLLFAAPLAYWAWQTGWAGR